MTSDPVEAGELHVEVRGDGEPVLLVMGLAMPGAGWATIVAHLVPRYRVATFDHRGVGRSADPARSTMVGLVDDALAVLDHLGWPRVHLVGVSMGGMIAQQLTLRHPERVHTLTLIATHSGGLFARIPTLRGFLALASRTRAKRVERLLHPPDRRAGLPPSALGKIRPGTLRAHLQAVGEHDLRTRIGSIRAPTLVMKPARDVLVRPSGNDRLAAEIPGARLEVFPRAGHGLIVHEHEAASAALLTHLEGHPLGRE